MINRKRNATPLRTYFNMVEELHEIMEGNFHYNPEKKVLFTQAIPDPDMTREEFIKHFGDTIRMNITLLNKIEGWFEGFKEDANLNRHLLLDDEVRFSHPTYNPPLTLKLLHKLYEFPKGEKTLGRWAKMDGVPPANNGTPVMYFCYDIEDMLDKRGVVFNKAKVKNILEAYHNKIENAFEMFNKE